ncbi:MAG: leucyl aminopeptidase, partial [Comamonadaceae bacterium]
MDVQLKTLSLAQAANEKTDALIVLTTSAEPKAGGPLATMLAQAVQSGDLADKPGKVLPMYRPVGVTAPRVVLVSMGDGSPAAVRTAVAAGVQAVKSGNPKRVTIVFAQSVDDAALRLAVLAAADATYVYTTTKPKADARTVRQLTFGVPDASQVRAAR